MTRRNRKLHKALLMTCCALALVAISVGVTLAYLTDSEGVTNTFTVGHVDIDLYETGPNGEPVKENTYHLIPGQTYKKDPTIVVKPGSEDTYVVAKIVVTGADDSPLVYETTDGKRLLGLAHTQPDGNVVNVISGDVFSMDYENKGDGIFENAKFQLTQTKTEGKDEYVFMVYCKDILKKANGHDICLFDSLNIPGAWTNQDIQSLKDLKIEVTAYGMQAAGFNNVFEAYEACDGTWKEYDHPNP